MHLAAATLCLALVAGAEPSAALKKDLALLQGTWVVQSMEMDGKFMSDATRKKIKLTVEGEKFTFDNGGDTHGGLYKLDPAKDPKTLDIVIERGGEIGKVYLVIYKFEDGKMIQAMRLDNKSRPGEFTGKAGSGCALEIWERAE